MRQPAVLIFDEPTNHLDHAAADRLLGLFSSLHQQPAILFITHDALRSSTRPRERGIRLEQPIQLPEAAVTSSEPRRNFLSPAPTGRR